MRKQLIFMVIVVMISPSLLAQSNWAVKSYEINFKIKNAGFNVDGKFTGFNAIINFDPQKLDKSNISASIEVKTISTGSNMRDKHLQKKEYFNSSEFPKIFMKSTKISGSGNKIIGSFQLKIKSIQKNIEFPFTFTETNGTGQFKGSFTINRQDYTVGGDNWLMSDNLTVNINVTAMKEATK